MARDRCWLLAGSHGPERMPARRHANDGDWYLPLHVRDAAAARTRIATQIVAGADVVVAPTWLTHRQALLPLGETRRAAAWTDAAVSTAREAIETGLERRAETLVDAGEDDPGLHRPTPLLAASLPSVLPSPDGSQAEAGRLLPRDAATERDYRDQAGILTDAQPDLLLVEGQASAGDAHAAMAEASQTGLPVWQSLSPTALAQEPIEVWLERARANGVERLLLPPPLSDIEGADAGDQAWGGVGVALDGVADWLATGASALALLDGAGGNAVAGIRGAIDDVEADERERHRAADQRWTSQVAWAAGVAPGGQAAWIGAGPKTPLPDGFAWSTMEPRDARALPSERFRLIVLSESIGHAVADALEPGGVLVTRGPAWPSEREHLRLLALDDASEPALAVYRREV